MVFQDPNGFFAVEATGACCILPVQATLRDLIIQTASAGALWLNGGVGERLLVLKPDDGIFTCSIWSGATLRDSICWAGRTGPGSTSAVGARARRRS